MLLGHSGAYHGIRRLMMYVISISGDGGGGQYYWTLALHEALPPRICALSLSTTGQQEKGPNGL